MLRKIFLLSLVVLLISCTDNTDKSLQKVDKGVDLIYLHKQEEAKRLFEEAIKIDPKNYAAYFYLGNYYSNKRKYHKAIGFYNQAIAINAHFADAYFNRGEAKFYLQDKKGACADWKLAAKNGRKNLEAKLKFCK